MKPNFINNPINNTISSIDICNIINLEYLFFIHNSYKKTRIIYILVYNFLWSDVKLCYTIDETKLNTPISVKTYKAKAIIPRVKPAIAIPLPPLFFPIAPNIIAKIPAGIDI